MLLVFLIVKYLLFIKCANSIEIYKVKKEGRGGGRNELVDYIMHLFM